MRVLIVIALLASVLVVGIVATPEDASFQQPAPEPFRRVSHVKGIVTIGTVSRLPSRDVDKYQGLADWLARRMTGWEYARGGVRFAPDMDTMADLLRDGDVDLYFDSPHPSLEVARRAGSVPILRRWKHGTPVYHSVIFTRADGHVDALDDLVGELVAFEELFSTSGYSLPRRLLEREGLVLVPNDAATSTSEITRFAFTLDDDNTVRWVSDGRAAAGAVDDRSFELLQQAEPGVYRELARTRPVPRQLVSIADGLSERFVAELVKALLAMHEDEDGRRVLERFSGTSRFDEVAPRDLEAIDAAFGPDGEGR